MSCCFPAGYAKRGLRSAIASAAKGVVVEEVMRAPLLAGQQDHTAAASSDDLSALVTEMQEVDRQWLSRKGKHAGESTASKVLCV
jgi:hypothetical protein